MSEFPTVYTAGWVTADTEGLPAASRAQLAREDRLAAREAAELAEQAAERLDSELTRAQLAGRT